MSKKEIFVKCEVCERDKKKSEFYSSSDSTHKNGCITICKKCAMNMVDMNNIETLRAFLERVNKPFIYTLYQSSINSKRRSSPLGNYFSNINMSSFKELTWKDSEGLEDALKDNYKEMFKTKDEIKEEKKLEEKSELQKELDDLGIDEKELIKLKKFWGMGHTPTEYHSYQVKYDSLVDNYSNQTTLHTEALKSYCVLKVKSEMLIANGGSTGDIKAFSELAQKQGEIAKLNLNKLDKSDFTSGMDSFGELVRMVEQEVDIIPILPQFTERPQDKIDVAIHCFLNYERRLAGMPDVEYDEIYDFYQKSLQDYLEDDTKSQEIKKYIVKKKIVRPNGTTREILFYDVYAVIEEKKRLNKDNKFIQNLDKWVEFISWARWNVDLWYDMITPESNSIALDVDQRMTLRIMSRYKFVYLVFPRGFSKTFLQLMYNFHTCIFYPNMEIAMTAQTMENASSLVESKWREILRFFPLLEKELKGKPLISKEKAIINFKSGGMIDTLQNGQSAKGQRRKRLSLEEFAQVSLPVFQDCLEPIPNIPRITLGKHGTINPYELNGQIIYLTTSWYVNTDAYDKSLQMRDNMIALKGDMVIGSDWTLACELGRGESRSTILERKMRTSSVAFSLNYESRWIGIISGGLVSINKVMDLRTLTRAELQSKRDAEYIISVDVARSQSTDNNQCSVAVLKIKRNKQSKIIAIQLVNMINIPSIMNFRVQAQEIMRIKNRYKAKMCVVDANGLGRLMPLYAEMHIEQFS